MTKKNLSQGEKAAGADRKPSRKNHGPQRLSRMILPQADAPSLHRNHNRKLHNIAPCYRENILARPKMHRPILEAMDHLRGRPRFPFQPCGMASHRSTTLSFSRIFRRGSLTRVDAGQKGPTPEPGVRQNAGH